jgi:hypothetical protein
MDGAVITFFVVDIGLVILGLLRKRPADTT